MGTSDTVTIDVTNYDANGYSLDWDNITITLIRSHVEGDTVPQRRRNDECYRNYS